MTAAEDSVFLDHAAATPLRPEVAEAMARVAAEAWANPSSPHAAGRRARRLLEESRERILALVGGRATGSGRDRLVFTSGTTESNRLALFGLAAGRTGAVASSARDHASVRGAVRELGDRGWRVCELPLDDRGGIAGGGEFPPDAPRPRILCLTVVCGQTGTVEPYTIAGGDSGVLVHADAAQAMLCHDVAFAAAGYATLAFAPGKFGGPRGIGATVVRAGVPFSGVVPGPQEAGLRGGTEAVSLAVGFARALEITVAERRMLAERIGRLRETFQSRLLSLARARGIEAGVVAPSGEQAPHLLVVALPGIDRQTLVMAADLEGVACASGTACASGSSEPAPAVTALGLDAETSRSVVRFSFGYDTTDVDVDRAVDRLDRVLGRLCRAVVDSSSPACHPPRALAADMGADGGRSPS